MHLREVFESLNLLQIKTISIIHSVTIILNKFRKKNYGVLIFFLAVLSLALDNLQFLFWIFAWWVVREYFEIDDLAPGTRN